ncbi:MAG TPA: hypothetical protein VD735_05215, partial [Candidatus Saccharimonadales bacterium]|nr:hypothetical protein [Candidatus Saccharimonadales bacterium]
YMGARKLTNEAPTLTREAHQFVQGALGERPQNNPQMVQRLGSLLRQLAPTTPPELEVARPPEERQQHYAAAQNAYPLRRISSSGVTVANYAINGGRPARQIYQASALSWALPALSSGEVPELPNVAAVVMTGVHKAPIEPLRMNLDQLRADGVSMLVQGRPDDPVLPLFSTGHFAVGQQSPAAATALSPFFGTTERARTASVAYGRHGSDNTGDNDGGSNNFEQGAQKAKGSGTTWGFTEGLGVTYDETVTENIATEATLTPEHLSDKVQPAEVVLFVGNTVLGAYNARTMRWERDFPPEVPQHPNNLSHVKAKINGIEAANAAARAQMQDKPANAAGLSDGVPLHQLPGAVREAAKMEPETAWGRKKELGRRYKDLHGVAAFSGRKETATNAALDFWYENLYIPSYEGDLRDSYNVSVGWIGWMHHNGLLGAREYQTALESLRLQA